MVLANPTHSINTTSVSVSRNPAVDCNTSILALSVLMNTDTPTGVFFPGKQQPLFHSKADLRLHPRTPAQHLVPT